MSFVRQIAERVLRDRTRLRRLPSDFGSLPIIVSSAGGLGQMLRPLAEVDPDLFATAKALVRAGNTVWDIGANVGLFTVAAAACAGGGGTIVSFEPDLWLVSLLRKTARLQPATAARIMVVPCGIARQTGARSFTIASRARASNSLTEYGNSQTGGSREVQTIVCLSADDCLASLPIPDVVKIDVEGAELELLEGAVRLLTEIRPAIACEVSQRNAAGVSSLLRNMGYRLFDASKPLRADLEIEIATWNTTALPEQKLAQLLLPM